MDCAEDGRLLWFDCADEGWLLLPVPAVFDEPLPDGCCADWFDDGWLDCAELPLGAGWLDCALGGGLCWLRAGSVWVELLPWFCWAGCLFGSWVVGVLCADATLTVARMIAAEVMSCFLI